MQGHTAAACEADSREWENGSAECGKGMECTAIRGKTLRLFLQHRLGRCCLNFNLPVASRQIKIQLPWVGLRTIEYEEYAFSAPAPVGALFVCHWHTAPF